MSSELKDILGREKLALQCSALKFLNPVLHNDNSMRRSDQWNSFTINKAFWSQYLKQYEKDTSNLSAEETTSSTNDLSIISQSLTGTQTSPISSETALPPRISLSRGSNKYVVIKATNPSNNDRPLFFVKSASPEECNGPYHANVAEKLLDQVRASGLNADVVGGGRIDHVETDHAHVYGFSYGFGKGDHKMVASLIEANTDIVATFDDSDGLY